MPLTTHPKFIVNPQGQPTEAVLLWQEYLDILEYLGMDLDGEAQACLRDKFCYDI